MVRRKVCLYQKKEQTRTKKELSLDGEKHGDNQWKEVLDKVGEVNAWLGSGSEGLICPDRYVGLLILEVWEEGEKDGVI